MCLFFYVQVHLKKFEYREKVKFFGNLFQKVKLSYILENSTFSPKI